ncbi:hypothetical protein NEUTE1DRAFT_150451 [Neurospora tetrasperma FGSC 2508]|uniref:DUF7492 domain-containing protein n=1 Tax=Neurospora tetrasperma (strain FGSC 2508 / ATCC MYA-4615 / P0657) TaxID=510951 RepID=F8N113_NEUT8|nr:uncharacterized protein NEUTE1DRAFT_150451 [Neurospora tetrasperma FGSC 2508]EGO53046.1 hypothetical protein NEUTE1DRAFT_150451 [Neurospora tetrasperma FGSC 2508]
MKTFSLKDTRGLLVAALFAMAQLSAGHSWPEQVRRIAPNGTLVGPLGYSRAYKPGDNQYMLLDKLDSALLYFPDRAVLTDQSYNVDYAMPKAAPGDWVAVQYNENGHVSLAEAPNIGRNSPVNRGTIYLYGTTNNDLADVRFADVHLKWTADGTGGDKKGRLLATRHFDDGQCREPVDKTSGDPTGIKAFRRANYKIPPTMGDRLMLYTIIWVWDWPQTHKRGVAVSPYTFIEEYKDPIVSVPEIYTGVVDIEIVNPCDESLGEVKGPGCKKGGESDVQFVETDSSKAAIRSQMANLFMVKVPQKGKAAKAGVDYNEADIPMAGLIGVEVVPIPISNDIQARNMARQKSMAVGGNLNAPSATQSGSPLAGGVFLSASSSTAPTPSASSTPVSSASEASNSAPTSIPATVSHQSSVSAPASTNIPTEKSGQIPVAGNTKFVKVTQTITIPASTVYVTETTQTAIMTATIHETAYNQTTSVARFRRGRGQWGFVSRN